MSGKGVGSRNAGDGVDDSGLVEVMFAKSLDEAFGCRSLLQEQDIPALVEDGATASPRCGIAVLVPSDRLVEASEVLATRAQDDDQLGHDCEDKDDQVAELEDDGDDDYDGDYEDNEEDEDEEDHDLVEEEDGI
jgi:hypothetical protein